MTIRNTEELIAALSDGLHCKYLYFWGHTPKVPGELDRACFSQWFPHAFEHEGVLYPTAEHFMMAGKARLFEDDVALAAILAAPTAAEAKKLGRTVNGFDQSSWELARFGIVVTANVAKFGSDAALSRFLLNTGERVLVEASPVDRIWGIGMDVRTAEHAHPQDWRGLNLLGFALMEARAQLTPI